MNMACCGAAFGIFACRRPPAARQHRRHRYRGAWRRAFRSKSAASLLLALRACKRIAPFCADCWRCSGGTYAGPELCRLARVWTARVVGRR